MPSCLGLYIENNLIKYAKVSKDKDAKQVETFGVKFCENLETGIRQVIQETGSNKIPISINITDETYDYFKMFALLKKADLEKAIKTEFESQCLDKGITSSGLEGRYALVEDLHDKQKVKAIYVSDNKTVLNRKMRLFDSYNLSGAYPLPMALPSLISMTKSNENSLIINIEEKTTITTILHQRIEDIKILEEGSKIFLDAISSKENSYAKAYDTCKETTIYTSEITEIDSEQTGYLEEIMPVLFSILGQVQKIINESPQKIQKVYLTGTGALVNNIDMYFQEYLDGVKCELLKPKFIPRTRGTNIKDYIEVNSAIAIALMGLGEGIDGLNFKGGEAKSLKGILSMEVSPKSLSLAFSNGALRNNLGEPLDRYEKLLLNVIAFLVIIFVVFTSFSLLLKREFNKKNEEVAESIENTKAQIKAVEADSSNIKQQKEIYTEYIDQLNKSSELAEERNKVKGAIPGLLNQLMNIVPTGVQIQLIQNTDDSKVEIVVQSPKYEQIAFFIGSIKTDVVLTDVIATSGQRNGDMITVKIEGVMP